MPRIKTVYVIAYKTGRPTLYINANGTKTMDVQNAFRYGTAQQAQSYIRRQCTVPAAWEIVAVGFDVRKGLVVGAPPAESAG